jgi:phosphate transport system substrate-binding protein
LNREADIIFCTHPSEYHLNKASELGVSFNLSPIGKEAFVFFVNKNNPIEKITSDQIRDIYSGKITNWKEINGKNIDILPYQRSENSGSQTIFQSIIGEIKTIEPLRIESMGKIIESVANYRNYPNAIGYSFLFFATEMIKNKEIKLLAIDGIFPSKKTIQNNTYPYSVLFYAITLNDNKNENVNLFIKWILSEQGQSLIEKTGYIPIIK